MQIAVKARAKNGYIQRALDSRGWTQKQLAHELGVDQASMGQYLHFKSVPRKKETIEAFERFFKLPIEMIFPETLKSQSFKKRFSKSQVWYTSVPDDMLEYTSAGMIEHQTAEDYTQEYEVREELRRLLHKLPKRLRIIINLRYGLTDGQSMSLRQVGDRLGVSRGRVGQLEAEAFRKLRAGGLEDFK